MKVAELIEFLKSKPQDAVVAFDAGGSIDEVTNALESIDVDGALLLVGRPIYRYEGDEIGLVPSGQSFHGPPLAPFEFVNKDGGPIKPGDAIYIKPLTAPEQG